ncbi:hypothetical protein V493_07100 [Pseudogymnoascus sp. VKM F-4281 (FW-2241)]|nr:hypothetical protein V493_07100 [Pseudogymnoascus sp. VKM F-4281 (FW-2241)]
MTTYIPSLTIPAGILLNPATSILLPVALGTAVGFSSRPREDQKNYMALKQPPCRPPPEVFGPLWTLFYGLMGYGAFRACNAGLSPLRSPDVIQATKHGATLYTIQLGLNLLWMPLFFVAKRPIEATVDCLALTGTVGYMTYIWGKVDAGAAWCMVPYLGWLCYASYLSAGVGYLNNWDLSDKTVDSPPSTKPGHTKFVDEKP